MVQEMILAIEDDDSVTVELILMEGLDPEARHDDSFYPNGLENDALLHWAARFNAPKCAQVEIESP